MGFLLLGLSKFFTHLSLLEFPQHLPEQKPEVFISGVTD